LVSNLFDLFGFIIKFNFKQSKKFIKMKNFKFLIGVFFVLLSLTFFNSCSKDESLKESSVKLDVENRSNSVGSFSIVEGRVAFPTIEDYKQTVNFLNLANEAELISFRNSINIETSAKSMLEFYNNICGDIELTDAQMNELENQYASKINIFINNEGEKAVELKYKVNPEFTNLEGEYQIAGTIVKQAGTNLVSVTQPSLVNIASINASTTTNASLGIFVTATAMASPSGCCPSTDGKEFHYTQHTKKKVIAFYTLLNSTQFFQDPFDSRKTLVIPQLTVNAQGKHERKKCVVFCWWGCDNTNMSHDFYINIDHNLCGVPNPIIINRTLSKNPTCIIEYKDDFFGCAVSTVPPLGVPVIAVCVNSVKQKVVANGHTVNIICN